MSRRSVGPVASRAFLDHTLPFDHLELGDLALGLAVRPARDDGCADGGDVPFDAVANDATRLARPRSIQGLRSASVLWRIMTWKAAMIWRASIRTGAPASTAATVTVSAFDNVSREVVISRAMVRAEGTSVGLCVHLECRAIADGTREGSLVPAASLAPAHADGRDRAGRGFAAAALHR